MPFNKHKVRAVETAIIFSFELRRKFTWRIKKCSPQTKQIWSRFLFATNATLLLSLSFSFSRVVPRVRAKIQKRIGTTSFRLRKLVRAGARADDRKSVRFASSAILFLLIYVIQTDVRSNTRRSVFFLCSTRTFARESIRKECRNWLITSGHVY